MVRGSSESDCRDAIAGSELKSTRPPRRRGPPSMRLELLSEYWCLIFCTRSSRLAQTACRKVAVSPPAGSKREVGQRLVLKPMQHFELSVLVHKRFLPQRCGMATHLMVDS